MAEKFLSDAALCAIINQYWAQRGYDMNARILHLRIVSDSFNGKPYRKLAKD